MGKNMKMKTLIMLLLVLGLGSGCASIVDSLIDDALNPNETPLERAERHQSEERTSANQRNASAQATYNELSLGAIQDTPAPVNHAEQSPISNAALFAFSDTQQRSATVVLFRVSSGLRTTQSRQGYSFTVGGIRVKPTSMVPESELLKHVGENVVATGKWIEGSTRKSLRESSMQVPVDLEEDGPSILGDVIMVESLQGVKKQ